MTVWFYCAILVNNKKKKLHRGCFVTFILHKPTAVEMSHENQTSTGGEAAQKSRAALRGTQTGQMLHVRHGTKPRTRVRWRDGVARSSSAQVEALGCEQLCNGPKVGGQSKEDWNRSCRCRARRRWMAVMAFSHPRRTAGRQPPSKQLGSHHIDAASTRPWAASLNSSPLNSKHSICACRNKKWAGQIYMQTDRKYITKLKLNKFMCFSDTLLKPVFCHRLRKHLFRTKAEK